MARAAVKPVAASLLRWEWHLALGLIVIVHAGVLMQRPVVGVADNRDFRRVMRPAGISHIDDIEVVHHRYVSPLYRPGPADLGAGLSSAAVLAWVAKLMTPAGRPMDIRQMGALYLVLTISALGLGLCAGVPPGLVALLAWAALDVSYSLYFNSFFADGAALVGLLGVALACLAWRPHSARPARLTTDALLVLAALVAGASKQLYLMTPLVPLAAIILSGASTWRRDLVPRGSLLLALIVAGLLTVHHFSWGSGYQAVTVNRYHMIFTGIVAASDEPAKVLSSLGIDEKWGVLRGKSFYELDRTTRADVSAEIRSVTLTDVVWQYLRNPRAVLRAVWLLRWPLSMRSTEDPNFEQATGLDPSSRYQAWWQFAALRHRVLGGRLWPLMAAALAACAVWLWRAIRRRTVQPEHLAAVFLLMNIAVLSAGAVLGDGLLSLPRHLIAVRYCIDLLLALLGFLVGRATFAWLGDRARIRWAAR